MRPRPWSYGLRSLFKQYFNDAHVHEKTVELSLMFPVQRVDY